MNSKVRVVIEFELEDEAIKEAGFCPEDIAKALTVIDSEINDGLEIFPVDIYNIMDEFFIKPESCAIVSKELIKQ